MPICDGVLGTSRTFPHVWNDLYLTIYISRLLIDAKESVKSSMEKVPCKKLDKKWDLVKASLGYVSYVL